MIGRLFVRFALLALALSLPTAAGAGGRVTLCATDVQSGPGTNLQSALAGGGLVRFGCAGGTIIQMTMVHTVSVATEIDGENKVFLNAASARAMFVVPSQLTLRRLTLRNQYVSIGSSPGPNGIAVGAGVIILIDSRVRGSVNPFTAETVIVTRSLFEGNQGYVLISAGTAIVSDSDFVNNPSAIVLRSGRPLGSDPPSVAVITNSRFRNNATAIIWTGRLDISKQSSFAFNGRGNNRSGGAIKLHGDAAIEHTVFDGNEGLEGGAIWMVGGSLTLRRVTFRDNKAIRDGGAIGISELAPGSIVTRYSTFAENSAARGGAIKLASAAGGTLALQGGPNTFAKNNASQEGGAIYSELGGIQLVRAIFTGNTAVTEGGAIRGSRRGHQHPTMVANSLIVRNSSPDGAAYSGSALTLINSTVAENQGVAIALKTLSHFSPPGARSEIDLRNAIVSNNPGGNCGPMPPSAVLLHNGHNLQHPGVQCGSAVTSADPQLDALYVPRFGSPAYVGGENGVCRSVPISGKDIYSGIRRQGQACSVGAVEGAIDPRRFLTILWRMRERVGQNIAALMSYFK